MRIACLAFVLLALCCSTLAHGQDKPIDKPILMLDTGGHQASIRSITFTPDGNHLISAGDDKVVRVWDWRAGKTVRTIRGQVGPGSEGRILAMALSPDGRWLAVGGFMLVPQESGTVIRLYDFASGTLKALLRGHRNVVFQLAFSPDSKLLISGSGLGDFTAIIWDVATATKRQQLVGHQAQVYDVSFTPDGARAVTASFDKTLRLWDVADGTLIKEMPGHSDKVSSMAVSPKDGTIASGDVSGEIRFWDSATGKSRGIFAKLGGWVGSLRFSPNGDLLLATCGYIGCDDKQRIFDVASGNELMVYARHDNIVIASAFPPDGRVVATGGGANNEIHIWDPRTSETKAILKGAGQAVWAAAFSSDSRQITWGQTLRGTPDINNRGPLEMILRLPDAGEAIGEPSRVSNAQDFVRAQASFGAFTLRHRAGGAFGRDDGVLEILNNGQVQARIARDTTNGVRHRSYTFTPDGQTIISGGANGVLTAYQLDGSKIGDFTGHVSEVWAVAVSPDGKYLVSGAQDQTVRLWDVKTCTLLVSLFYGTDGEWVMWTPEGFYTSSKKGAERVGWQINRGADKAADHLTGDQVRDAFFRPDLVAAKIAGDPEGKVKEAATELNIADVVSSGIAPEVTITKTAVREDTVTEVGVTRAVVMVDVTARIVDKGGGIGLITWRINDALIKTDYGAGSLNPQGEITRSFELAYPDNTVLVGAENESGKIESKSHAVAVKADEKAVKGLPNLYILAVGVNGYRDVKYKLRFAISDAETLSEAIADAGTGYYRSKPQVTMLSDDEVTADKLEAAFTELGGKIRATDVFLFFIAGHGMTIKGDYYFLPSNVTSFSDEAILTQGFGKTKWREWFAKIAAQKAIFIFDTCDSGSVSQVIAGLGRGGNVEFETAQQRLKEAIGRTLFTASSDEQSAIEGYRNHGLLTYAILEGLAKAGGDKPLIWLTDLKDYVEDKVRAYSKEMKTCSVVRLQEYCQQPKVLLGEHNYAVVPRYEKILAKIEAGGETYSRIPTHVIIALAEVRQAARGEGTTIQLPPGTLITVVKTEGDYAYVAKDGKPLGYVLLSQLAKLN